MGYGNEDTCDADGTAVRVPLQRTRTNRSFGSRAPAPCGRRDVSPRGAPARAWVRRCRRRLAAAGRGGRRPPRRSTLTVVVRDRGTLAEMTECFTVTATDGAARAGI